MVLLSLLVPVALVLRAFLLPEVDLAPVVTSPAGSVQGMVMTSRDKGRKIYAYRGMSRTFIQCYLITKKDINIFS